jgi:hypothetical protein
VGRQHTTLENGTIAYNWHANVVGAAIESRLKGERSIPFWPEGKSAETGGISHDRQPDLWFVEVRPFGTPGPFKDYLEITHDEAAAWLESHGYELPEPLVPSLQREDGIFWVISEANTSARTQPKPTPATEEKSFAYAVELLAPKAEIPPGPKIVLSIKGNDVTVDGITHHLDDSPAAFVQELVDAGVGVWRSGRTMGEAVQPRPDRVYKKLPEAIRGKLESRDGLGYRIRPV